MKKLLLIAGFVSSLSFSFAQSAKLILKAGLNLSNLSYNNAQTNSGSTSTSNLTGFHIGALADFGLGAISIQPGILYTTKGGKEEDSQSGGSGSSAFTAHSTSEISLNYLEIPINVLYHVPVGVGKIFIGGGPYIAMGISGKSKFSATQTGNPSYNSSGEGDVTFGSSIGNIKNPDYGINALGGISLKEGLQFSIGYGFGLNNLSNVSGNTTKNNTLSLSIGYSFL